MQKYLPLTVSCAVHGRHSECYASCRWFLEGNYKFNWITLFNSVVLRTEIDGHNWKNKGREDRGVSNISSAECSTADCARGLHVLYLSTQGIYGDSEGLCNVHWGTVM